MIDYTKEDKVAVITINHPEAYGALTVKGHDELHNALADYRDDDDLLVCILTGTGDKAFCSGVDIKDMLPFIKKTALKPWLQISTLMRGMDIWKPVIAAINGLALGGGLELTLGCDIRIASENAKFGFPEPKVGMFPGGGGTQRLPRLIPRGIASEMILAGRQLNAEEALHFGLVNKVVPLSDLIAAAQEMAGKICQMGPLAIRTAKEAMVRGMNLSLEEGLRLETTLTPAVVFSHDFEEGLRAFSEKRKPEFEGR